MAQQRPAPRTPSAASTRGAGAGARRNPNRPTGKPGGSGGRRPPQRDGRRQTGLILGGTAVVAIAIIVALVVTLGGGGSSSNTNRSTALPAFVTVKTTNVPLTTLEQVGLQQPATSLSTGAPGQIVQPTNVSGSGPALTSGGKPQLLYLGAEYCPYCATERWAMVVALSQFGTFTNLGGVTAPPLDGYSSINTFSFHGSTYSSPYFTFVPREEETTTGQALDTPTKAESELGVKYANQPYGTGTSNNSYSFPFLDFGNQTIINGASYSPAIVAGKSYQQLVQALQDPTSDQARSVYATANFIIASICKMTNGQGPTGVCTAPFVSQAQSLFQPPYSQRSH